METLEQKRARLEQMRRIYNKTLDKSLANEIKRLTWFFHSLDTEEVKIQ